MKKKNYVAPQIKCHQAGNMLPLCASPLNRSVQSKKGSDFWDDDFDLTYGGIDYESDGLLDPS